MSEARTMWWLEFPDGYRAGPFTTRADAMTAKRMSGPRRGLADARAVEAPVDPEARAEFAEDRLARAEERAARAESRLELVTEFCSLLRDFYRGQNSPGRWASLREAQLNTLEEFEAVLADGEEAAVMKFLRERFSSAGASLEVPDV